MSVAMHSVVLMVSPPTFKNVTMWSIQCLPWVYMRMHQYAKYILQTCMFLHVHVHGIFVGMWGETLYCTIATRPNH